LVQNIFVSKGLFGSWIDKLVHLFFRNYSKQKGIIGLIDITLELVFKHLNWLIGNLEIQGRFKKYFFVFNYFPETHTNVIGQILNPTK